MTTFVLDASAVIRYADREPGAERVREILIACTAWKADLCISAVQWGEVAGNLRKRFGALREEALLGALLPSEVRIVPATAERAVRAAALKVDRNLAYAGGFALNLAMDSPDHVLVTADYGFKTVEDLARIEFLPRMQ
jgi:predicted nucleic acid-binding protein